MYKASNLYGLLTDTRERAAPLLLASEGLADILSRGIGRDI